MIYNNEELKKLQKVELDILKEFVRICEQLNLNYFLDGGTLLGCIRNEGFIPWDDDIDVIMPRKDYEVFISKSQSMLQDKYFLQNDITDSNFTWEFTKIRNSNTTFIETIHNGININHGVYIDIFPLDGYSPKKYIKNVIMNFKKCLINIQIWKFRYEENNNKIRKIVKNILFKGLSNVLYGKKELFQLLKLKDEMASKYDFETSKYVANNLNPVKQYNQPYTEKNILIKV